MNWLQGAFVTRFNRLANERGHLFQGRYTSILIGEERPLLRLVNLHPPQSGACVHLPA
jgi:hypothetical protein